MLRGPTVRDDGSGNAVLIKHATGAERLRLAHEAQVLTAARVDGVVECVGLVDFDDRCELRVRYLEAAPLSELPPLRPHEAFDVLIDLGTTLAELHARGIHHGALRGEHVLLAQPRRPVLCGFGDATGPGDQSQHLPGADLAALAALATSALMRADRSVTEATEHRSCADALIVCESLAATASTAPSGSEPLTQWLVRMRHIREAAGREQTGVADGFGLAKPLTTTFAHDLNGLRERLRADVTASAPPDADARGSLNVERSMPSTRDRRRIASYAALATTLAVAAIIGWRSLAVSRPDAESFDVPSAAAAAPVAVNTAAPSSSPSSAIDNVSGAAGDVESSSTTLSNSANSPLVSLPAGATLLYSTAPTNCPDPAEAEPHLGPGGESEFDDTRPHTDGSSSNETATVHRADVRGNGCPVPVHIEMSAEHRPTAAVRSPDGQWTVGSPGDFVTIGDWDCDGRSTLAVLSSSTGIVGFFSSWPRTEHPVVPARITHVPQQATAVSIASPAHGASGDATDHLVCDSLVVHYGELSLTLPRYEPVPGAALLRRVQPR